jgi:hypothetical protein
MRRMRLDNPAASRSSSGRVLHGGGAAKFAGGVLAAIAELIERRSRAILLIGIPVIVLLAVVRSELNIVLWFDDAFMFWRYAVHLRDGFGMAWNAGGEATYGLTSQLWVYFVLPFTYTAIGPARALQLASFVMGLSGLALGGFAMAGSKLRVSIYVALVVLLLLLRPFAYHLTTGMDTMLSFTTNVALLAALDAWRRARRHGALLVGLAAFVTVLARPENVIVAFGVSGMAWLLLRPSAHPWPKLVDAAWMLCLPAALIGVDLLVCQAVYGTALPLSFYAKSGAAYDGFLNVENPMRYMAQAALAFVPSLALWCAFGRGHARYLLVVGLPVLLTVLYLLTVRQIMGFQGRYYIPFVPFVLLPAVAVTADGLARSGRIALPKAWLIAAIPVAAVALLMGRQAVDRVEAAWLSWTVPAPVPQPTPVIAARSPVPSMPETQGWTIVAQRISRRLPKGTVFAASEVGQIGGYAPDVTIIDLAGLNDREIGLHGFSAGRLVERAPDLIWLPHNDYTGARAALLANPRFRTEYRFLVGAFDYGLATRIDGPRAAAIEEVVAEAWRETYPGLKLDDYVARWPAGAETAAPAI